VDPDSKGRRQPGGAANGSRQRLQVSVTDGRGRPVRDGGLSRWLASIAPATARGEVAIALVTDEHSQKLNSQFRHKQSATDVLSFPAGASSANPESRPSTGSIRPERVDGRIPDHGPRLLTRFLGDIVIATGTARKQARDARHSYQAELRVLALHGLLHLLGYDHEHADDAGRMRRIEARLRRRGGLRAGLIERS
jgi:probable rRNA maturation factor